MDNIAIIISKLNGGGAERSASNISILLSESYNVHLIVFDGSDIKYPYKGELHDLQLPPANNKVFNLMKRVKMIRMLKRNYHIRTSISFMDGPNIANVLSDCGENIITSVRINMSFSHPENKIKYLLRGKIMKFIGRKSHSVIALSKGVAADLIDNYKISSNKVKVIYNPCDGEMLLNLTQNRQKVNIRNDGEFIVSTMGRLNSQKGQWHLIRAFSKVLETYPSSKLYILGEGELLDKLQKLTTDLGIQKNVIFTGFIEAPHRYIAESDVFIFPSLFEGLGNALLEAMACGVACISTDCPSGPREILTGEYKESEPLMEPEYTEYGVLTSVCGKEEFNAEEPLSREEIQMSDAIISLLGNQSLRESYRQKSIQRSKDFLPEKIKEDWIAAIENE